MKRYGARGFTLPTVVIVSVLMFGALALAVQMVAVSSSSLKGIYVTQLAREAAESGARRAESCLRENSMSVTWTEAKPLKPNTDCSGNVLTELDAYLMNNGGHRALFAVNASTHAEGIQVQVQGIVEQLNTSSGTVINTFSQSLKAEVRQEPVHATSISSGLHQVCVVLSGNTWCNGGNQYGQMGNGRVESLAEKVYLQPERVAREEGLLRGRTDKIVVSGMQAACTVTTDSEIYCWGRSGYGYLGLGNAPSPPNPQTKPAKVLKPVGMTGEVTAIAMGWDATCAVSGGDVWCWGRNHYGQVGDGTTTHRYVPVRVSTIGTHAGRPVTDIASHPYAGSFCAVAGGDAYCWGRNTYGQLGDNTTTNRYTPVAVLKQSGRLAGKTITKVVHVAATRQQDGAIDTPDGTGGSCTPSSRSCYVQSHSCALTSDGQVYCWGSNQYGQMGQGTWSLTNQFVPIRVLGALDGKVVRDIASSYYTPCALTTEADTGDRLYCWGGNQHGAGGLGHTNVCNNNSICSPTPVVMQTPGLQGRYITSINAGVNRMCALADGVSYCTGLNTHAQLGDGTLTSRSVPTEAKVFRKYQPVFMF